MLRRQCRDKNRNIKRFGVLPINGKRSLTFQAWALRQKDTWAHGPSRETCSLTSERNMFSDEGPTLETLDFAFRLLAVYQPYISILTGPNLHVVTH